MTLSSADIHLNELVLIIRKLKQIIGDSDISGLDYDSRRNELDSNPVLLPCLFQYRVENFFKEIIMNGQLGKIKLEVVPMCISWYGQAMSLN